MALRSCISVYIHFFFVHDLWNSYSQVKGLHDSTDARYNAVEKRLAALESQQATEAAPEMDTPSH
jgi:hypothetical protein